MYYLCVIKNRLQPGPFGGLYFMKVAAVGFCCIDIYENLNIHYPTGNGIQSIDRNGTVWKGDYHDS